MLRRFADSLKHSTVRSFIVALMLLAMPVGAQYAPPLNSSKPSGQPAVPIQSDANDDSAVRHMTKNMAKSRNRMRQQQITSAADKLLELAEQLDADVGKSHPEALSAAEWKNVEEIEKLSKIVKDKMRYGQ